MNERSPLSDLESLAAVLEELAQSFAEPLDRSRIRRALEEASMVLSGSTAGSWWQWTVEASQSLGLKCRVVDATPDQLLAVVRDGGKAILYDEKSRRWFAASSGARKVTVIQPDRTPTNSEVSLGKLQNLLREFTSGASLRCVIIEPGLLTVAAPNVSDHDHSGHGHGGHGHSGHGHGHHGGHEVSPLERLLKILRPEARDIWHIFVFALVTGVLTLATPLAVESLVNTVAFGRFLQPIIVLATILLSFLAFSAALRALQAYVAEIIQRRLFARVAADLAYRIPRVRAEVFDQEHGRELLNRFFDVTTLQKSVTLLVLDGISLVLNATIGMAVLGFYHPWLLGFDLVLILLISFAVFVLGRGGVKTSIKESKTKYHVAAWLEELAICTHSFRLDGAPEFALERADRLIYEYLLARKKHFRVLIRQILFVLILQAVASTALLGLGGWLVVSGQLTLGQLVAAELIVTVIVGSFAKLGKPIESFYDLMAAVDKLGILFDLPMEPEGKLLDVPDKLPATVSLQHLTYHHPASHHGLHDLNLQIASGQHTAIVGRSGSGKSLLLDVLYGLRVPESGVALINNVDPRSVRPDVYRRSVSLARSIESFEGSIADHVHLERPEISTSEVKEALRSVGLLDDVLHLPRGVDTTLSPSGGPLTSQQLQRLMLARVIVNRPTLLLIDGLLDYFADDEALTLLNMLIQPNQPWTLVLVTGRRCLLDKLRVIDLNHSNDHHSQAKPHGAH